MLFECPHCGIRIEIVEINCGIFRCGILKDTGQQIDPHLSKVECEALAGSIWGCSRPFKYEDGSVSVCEYI